MCCWWHPRRVDRFCRSRRRRLLRTTPVITTTITTTVTVITITAGVEREESCYANRNQVVRSRGAVLVGDVAVVVVTIVIVTIVTIVTVVTVTVVIIDTTINAQAAAASVAVGGPTPDKNVPRGRVVPVFAGRLCICMRRLGWGGALVGETATMYPAPTSAAVTTGTAGTGAGKCNDAVS